MRSALYKVLRPSYPMGLVLVLLAAALWACLPGPKSVKTNPAGKAEQERLAYDVGIDDFQASRSPDHRYRTTPLRGLFVRAKGGFYHDGRFATLDDVVNHYDRHRKLRLTPEEKKDLVEYQKSL